MEAGRGRRVVIGPGGLEGEGQRLGVEEAQAGGSQGRSQEVVAVAFEAGAVAGLDPDGGVQEEAAGGLAQGRGAAAVGRVGPPSTQARSDARAGGHGALDGGGGEGGRQRLLLDQGIGLVAVQQAVPREQPDDALVGVREELSLGGVDEDALYAAMDWLDSWSGTSA